VSALGKEVIKATIISIGTRVSGQFGGETNEHLWGARNKLGVFELSKDQQVRGATIFVILNCMIYVVCCMIG